MSACEIVEKIKTKQLSCIEVAEAFIKRIIEVNPKINAIHQFNPERILDEAQQKDKELKDGVKCGRLHGLPISLKDGFFSPGFKCGKGSKRLHELSPTNKAATAVKRLVDEGAIILGITNVPEYLAASETDNILNGRTINPYNKTRVAGGSSGGEAALIATGGSCIGLGSDAIGSVREPAAYCGIAALKPTKGMVPLTGLIPGDGGSLKADLSMYGPMARQVEDLDLFLSIISGPDYKDPSCAPVPLKSYKDVNVSELKSLYFISDDVTEPSKDVQQTIEHAIKELAIHLKQPQLVRPPEILKDTYKLAYETCYLEGNKGELYDELLERIEQTEFSPLYDQYLQQVHDCEFSNAELHRRIGQIYKYKRAMFDLIDDADILLLPTTPTTARNHGTAHDELNDFEYTMISSITGWPAASINCGFSSEGLPIGLQICAKPWNDHLVLAYAKKAQEIFGVPNIITPA